MRADRQRQSGAEREGEAGEEVGEAGGEGEFKGITVFRLEWLAVGTRDRTELSCSEIPVMASDQTCQVPNQPFTFLLSIYMSIKAL